MLLSHHQQALDRFVQDFSQKNEVQAILVGGSLVKEFGKADSDVDVMIIVDEAAYQARQASADLTFYSTDYTDYQGGYVDGKFMGSSFLELVAEKGSEPARAAFLNAYIAWSRADSSHLQALVDRINTYDESTRIQHIQRFVAQVQAMHWYVGEAERHDNPYLLNWSAVRAVLFTTRVLLAHNRLFFPYHKWASRMLERAADKPEQYLQRADALMRAPTAQATRELCELVLNFKDWGVPERSWPSQFALDSELNWLSGHTPVEDL
ncbi:MAG: nucleotidyltransferase domain-containing protein [Pseudomonadota bacterium]